jgi:RNA polymerase sigma factor for flagellar operon FliA
MVSTMTTPKKRGRKPLAKKAAPAVKTRTVEKKAATALQPVAKRAKRNPVSEREWRRYRKMQSHEMRQDLLNKYLPLVRNVASRMAMGFPRSVELPDLINTGVIGLVEAFGNFDPSRGVKFETYAVPRIRGAILDELRALDWVPRSTRAKSREIERAFLELENQLGRPPEKTELAKYLKITIEELHLSLEDVSGTNILSLDEVIFREDDNRQVPRVETIMDTGKINILGEIEKDELRAFLVIAMDKLTGQERLVIALYYYEELTLKEIGEVMSISESRVSQIHTRAVSKLRNMVQEKFAQTG